VHTLGAWSLLGARIGVRGGPERLGVYHASIAHGGVDFGVECSVVIVDEVGRGKAAICLWDAIMDLGASAPFVDEPTWSWVDSWHGELWVWGGAWWCGNGCKVRARGSWDQCEVGVVTSWMFWRMLAYVGGGSMASGDSLGGPHLKIEMTSPRGQLKWICPWAIMAAWRAAVMNSSSTLLRGGGLARARVSGVDQGPLQSG
jgi:hypothetical protein